MKIKFLKMLQADTTSIGGGTDTQVEISTETTNQETEQKAFTQEDIDRIVSKRLDQAQKKWEKQTQSQIEAVKVSSMSQEEKENYEKSKYDRILQEKEEMLRVRELKLDAVNILSKKNITPDLMDFLDYTDENSMNESIDKLQGIITELANKEVDRRFAKSSYKPPSNYETYESDAFIKGLNGSK